MYMHTYMYVSVWLLQACVHACVWAHICVHAFMYVCVCVCVHMCACVCVYMCMHTYLYVCVWSLFNIQTRNYSSSYKLKLRDGYTWWSHDINQLLSHVVTSSNTALPLLASYFSILAKLHQHHWAKWLLRAMKKLTNSKPLTGHQGVWINEVPLNKRYRTRSMQQQLKRLPHAVQSWKKW